MKRLIVLRPEPGASETVRRAHELGLDALAIPLFETQPVRWTAPDSSDFDALLLTSANAIRLGGAGLDSLRGLPVYAVGPGTADASRNAGFAVSGVGDGGVDELLGKIDSSLRLLHLCGEDRRQPSTNDRSITAIPVYRSVELPARDTLKQAEGAVVLVHSPRAGVRIAHLLKDNFNWRGAAIAAISPAAAAAAGDGWLAVESAERPTDEALLALALRLCDKPAGT